MDRHEAIENRVAANAEADSSAYVPTLQLTKGQPPPIAANGGLSYMSFDRDGDAGTTAAIEAALEQIADGEGQALIDRIENAPPRPHRDRVGPRVPRVRGMPGPYPGERHRSPGRRVGAAAALHRPRAARPTPSCRPTRSGGTRRARPRRSCCARPNEDNGRRYLYFPQVMRDVATHRGVLPRSLGPAAPNAWTSSEFRWRTSNRSARTSMTRRRWNACSTRRSSSSSWSSSRMRPMRSSTTTTSSTRTTRATARKTRTPRTPA